LRARGRFMVQLACTVHFHFVQYTKTKSNLENL
jgi:hypothetical protein